MGNMSRNKLGGMCLIIGPVLALIFYMLQPGNMIISPADTADAGASMAAMQSNAMITSLSALLIPLGLIMWLFGIRTLNDAGDSNAWGSFGVQFILIATIGWVASIGLQHVVAAGPGDAMAAYTVSAGLSNVAGVISCIGVLMLSLAIASREGINKILSYIVAIAAVISGVLGVVMLLDPAQSEMAQMVGGIVYIIWCIWFILSGINLVKQG